MLLDYYSSKRLVYLFSFVPTGHFASLKYQVQKYSQYFVLFYRVKSLIRVNVQFQLKLQNTEKTATIWHDVDCVHCLSKLHKRRCNFTQLAQTHQLRLHLKKIDECTTSDSRTKVKQNKARKIETETSQQRAERLEVLSKTKQAVLRRKLVIAIIISYWTKQDIAKPPFITENQFLN